VGSIGGVTMSGADVERTHTFDPAERDSGEFDGAPRPENRDFMVAQASRVLPDLARSEIVAHLAGVRPLSADRMPLIGPVPALEGAFIAGGHGTKGIHLAPITGRTIAELVRGDEPKVRIEAFAPDRFTSFEEVPLRTP
jgi:glycine/D-amino acid oxidase-like deaminating enzyme